MKTYLDHGEIITEGGRAIPKDPANRDYVIFQEELAKGDAELTPFEKSEDQIRIEKQVEFSVTPEAKLDAIWQAITKGDTTKQDDLVQKEIAVEAAVAEEIKDPTKEPKPKDGGAVAITPTP